MVKNWRFVACIVLFMLLGVRYAGATAQSTDILIYEGKELPLTINPLEPYFNKQNPRPDFVAESTANWRGYMATFEIRDATLYLKDLKGRVREKDKTRDVGIKFLFPKQKGPVKAEWFTGSLSIPQGEMLHYVHMGYESIYEKMLIISVNQGNVTGTKVVDTKANWPKNRQEAVGQFLAFLPEKTREVLQQRTKDNLFDASIFLLSAIEARFGLWDKDGNSALMNNLCPKSCKPEKAAEIVYQAAWEQLQKR